MQHSALFLLTVLMIVVTLSSGKASWFPVSLLRRTTKNSSDKLTSDTGFLQSSTHPPTDRYHISYIPQHILPTKLALMGLISRAKSAVVRFCSSPEVRNVLLSLVSDCIKYAVVVVAFRALSESLVDLLSKGIDVFEQKGSVNKLGDNFTELLKPNTTLTASEKEILQTIVLPQSIEERIEDIGGLALVKDVLLREFKPSLSNSTVHGLLSPPASMLLFGPPGCGESPCSCMSFSLKVYVFYEYLVCVFFSRQVDDRARAEPTPQHALVDCGPLAASAHVRRRDLPHDQGALLARAEASVLRGVHRRGGLAVLRKDQE